MFKSIAFVCFAMVLLMSTIRVSAEDAPPEVVAARSSAKEHNHRVRQAQAELDQVMERARKKYTEQVIQAKERLVKDLRRTLRDAAESDRPENLVAISQQIKRLNSQIETLRNGPAAADQPNPDAQPRGFERYQGSWSIAWANGHKRRFEIDADGRVTIRSNSSGNGAGSGVGSVYQAKLIDGSLAYHDRNWTKGSSEQGRLILLKRNDDDTVTIGYSEKDLKQADTFKTADEVWNAKLIHVYSRAGQPKPADHKDADDKKDKPPVQKDDPVAVNPQPSDKPDATDTTQQDDTFFGVPLE